jgi:hypothetical protein
MALPSRPCRLTFGLIGRRDYTRPALLLLVNAQMGSKRLDEMLKTNARQASGLRIVLTRNVVSCILSP